MSRPAKSSLTHAPKWAGKSRKKAALRLKRQMPPSSDFPRALFLRLFYGHVIRVPKAAKPSSLSERHANRIKLPHMILDAARGFL
jgi:hypothetical protein